MRALNVYLDCGRCQRAVPFLIERYSSLAEVASVTSKRAEEQGPIHGTKGGNDYFGGTEHASKGWSGFSNTTELRKKMVMGVQDTKVLDKVTRFTKKARAEDVQKYCKLKRGVCGGSVDIPRYLTGTPDCMIGIVKSNSRSKFIRIGVASGFTCDVSIDTVNAVGMALARAVKALELAKYRVGLDVAAVHASIDHDACAAMVIPVKTTNASLNLSRLMFPLSDPAFFRGVSFGWVARVGLIPNRSGLSTRADRMWYSSETADLRAQMLEQIFGKDHICFDVNELCDRYIRDKDVDKLYDYIMTVLLDLE